MISFRFTSTFPAIGKTSRIIALACHVVFFPIFVTAADENKTPPLSIDDIAWIGEMIFANECNRQSVCLTSWNAGEDFPSLGIGHFIWYQQRQSEIFDESFPALMRFMESNSVDIPGWLLEVNLESPWPDRAAFQADLNSDRMRELRNFLNTHKIEQTAFIISRFETALADIVNSLDMNESEQKTQLTNNFHAVANSHSPFGLYALIDYVNFKGKGVSDQEQYRNQGWGLKQVLLDMGDIAATDENPLQSFINSARQMLATRISNAPADRNESRWLAGWNNRLDSYLPPTMQPNPDNEAGNTP